MPVIVHDKDGSAHDWSWLQANYAAGLRYHEAEGYPRFSLTDVFITEGPTNLTFNVIDAQGFPQSGQPVAYSYPNPSSPSSALPLIPAGASRTRWTDRACIEYLDPMGAHNFQIGSESWIKNGYGPYNVGVISPSTFSDWVEGIGWLGGTNHRGPCWFKFREVLVDPVIPPEPGGGGDGDYDDLIAAIAAVDANLRKLAAHLGLDL